MSTNFEATDRLIDEIQNAVKAQVVTVDGHELVDGDLKLPPLPRTAEALGVHSLSALAEYVNTQKDQNAEATPFLVSIKSPTKAIVYQWLDLNRQREKFLVAEAIVTNFQFGQYQGVEQFIIGLQTQFAETEDQAAILELVSKIADEATVAYEDDGITQKVTAKVGIARQANVTVPRIVSLRPYRTFKDVDRQPDGKFLLRLQRAEGKPPQAALFEADGGLWQNDAIAFIKSYLEANIEEGKAIIIG